jgi:hypothetical protein
MRLTLCLILVLAVAFADAQDNFPDVPKGHWAYKEVSELRKEGLLKGYPDGLFRGGRPATRFELAVAVHAAWSKHKGLIDGLNAKVLDIIARSESPRAISNRANVEAAIANARLQTELDRDAIRSLQRLLGELAPELRELKLSIEKARISSLGQRVGKLEKSKPGG